MNASRRLKQGLEDNMLVLCSTRTNWQQQGALLNYPVTPKRSWSGAGGGLSPFRSSLVLPFPW